MAQFIWCLSAGWGFSPSRHLQANANWQIHFEHWFKVYHALFIILILNSYKLASCPKQ